MQLITEGTGRIALTLARRLKANGVLYTPVGIENGWMANDPAGSFLGEKRPTFVGLIKGLAKRTFIKVRVGKPIRSDDPIIEDILSRKAYDELDDHLGFALAAEVSPHTRGVYKDEQTLAQAKAIRAQKEYLMSL